MKHALISMRSLSLCLYWVHSFAGKRAQQKLRSQNEHCFRTVFAFLPQLYSCATHAWLY
jgi:hypothetical protein